MTKKYWITACSETHATGLNRQPLREAFKKKSFNKVNVLIGLDPLPPPLIRKNKIRKFLYPS